MRKMEASVVAVGTLQGHNDRVWDVAWNPKGNLLATCSSDKTIRLWNQEGEKWVCSTILDGAHQRTIRSVAWSPCGAFLASSSFDGTTSIWDKNSGQFECSVTLEGHENEVKAVAWAPSGQVLATCSRDKSVWIWQVDEEDQDYECASVLSEHTQDVKHLTWHPHKDMLASCSYDDTIKLFREDTDDWFCFATLESHASTVWSICFDKTGQRLASCSDDKTIKIWQEYQPGNPQGISTQGKDSTWKCVCTLSGYHSRTIYDVAWCHLTGLLATACGDDCIRIFREESDSDPNQPSFTLVTTVTKAHSNDVNSVSWNRAVAGLLASGSDDGTVKLWKFVEN